MKNASWLILAALFGNLVIAADGGEWRTLIADDMERGLKEWSRQGNADFREDSETVHGGKGSARIVVKTPAYQQLRRKVGGRVFPGDRYRASAWVRTKDLSGGTGGYLYIEFLNGTKRVSILHSKTGLANGLDGWTELGAEGVAPAGCDGVVLGLVLHATGTAWFDDVKLETNGKPAEERKVEKVRISIDGKKVINPDFLGFGFHVFFPVHVKQLTPRIRNEVLYKRWLEMRPSFARITHNWNRGEAHVVELIATMKMMQKTNTRVYLTTWDPKATPPGAEREAYAKQVGELLERLRKEGCSNLLWYCLTNELSLRGDIGNGVKLSGWGTLRSHMEAFKDYHRLFHAELKLRKLDIGLLAADESPNLGINKARWARKHMDDITAAYGGHHYINDRSLEDPGLYDWFLKQSRTASAIAPEKPFLIGEFGAKQHRGSRYGFSKWDGCAYYDTDKEPLVAIQVAEAVLAAVNGGIDATAYWTFADFPDDYQKNKRYANKWGTSRWSKGDHSTRDLHYGLALLTRYFRGPCEALRIASTDSMLRTACVRQKDGAVSVAMVNRHPVTAPVHLELGITPQKPLRKYIFDPSRPPQHPFGDLPAANELVKAPNGTLEDKLLPMSLVVYTTDYDEKAPANVRDVRSETTEGKRIARWSPVADEDLCYYRVFVGERQVGSTVTTSLILPDDVKGEVKVKAVDSSGNVSR